MKRIIAPLALFLLLSACGGLGAPLAPVDFLTRFGSAVALNGHPGWISQAEADELQSSLLADLKWGPKAEECLNRVAYQIEAYPIVRCEPSGHSCFGYELDATLYVGAAPRNQYGGDGPRRSAFKHETIHYLQKCVSGIVDVDHRRPEWTFE